MKFTKIIGVILIGVGVWALNVSFQTYLPNAEDLLQDKTGNMLESVKNFCPHYDPNDKDTFEPCQRVFDTMRTTWNVVGIGLFAGGILSYYKWLLQLLEIIRDKLLK
ncbi:hypothetical protein SCCGRSA3_01587 [Marine Group I thaumarchaeote SCGC RSA3]|uniref:Uncharacterized protein n=2 Tax=Marine Group I TaxID=905826 RepID=A0A081RPT0_9ARCH|nr:hypothetical protein AAA799N04_00153 [Marine Group I thaumarchaeote SCGC AAA799-N04]KFM17657.1 hypothetical protein SCCGRSA3_01587 [Marine Group I thaumarchaeote SCGC RSA3]